MITVIASVAIPVPEFPKRLIARAVAKEEASEFTKLFPMRITVKRTSVLLFSFAMSFAFGCFSFCICLSRILGIHRKAVSEEEKNAERQIRIPRDILIIVVLIHLPPLLILYLCEHHRALLP